MALLNLQSFGEGLDFCFDGSKEGGFRFIESRPIYKSCCEHRYFRLNLFFNITLLS